MHVTFNDHNNRFVCMLHKLENSEIISSSVYSDDLIKLYTYTVKETNKNNIIGYRVDLVGIEYQYNFLNEKMFSVMFGETQDNTLSVVYDDTEFRIIKYGTSKYSFVVKKAKKHAKKKSDN